MNGVIGMVSLVRIGVMSDIDPTLIPLDFMIGVFSKRRGGDLICREINLYYLFAVSY